MICSSYRTQAKQQELYENKLQRLIEEGYSYENAVTEAGTVVAVPGTSEHQTGLALDIVDASYQILDQGQEDTLVQQWLIEHSWEYGFVLRYPNAKSEITGIIYEPWHYRYVGREAAREMTELDLCLEEYVDWALRPVSHRIYANDALDRYDVQGAVLSWFVVLTAVWPCGNRRRAGRRDSPVCRHGETAPFRPRPGPLRRRKPPGSSS